MEESFSPIQPWYRTKAGIAFLAILSTALFGTLIFLSFFGYYFWQITYGDAQKLAEQFNPKFTTLPGSAAENLNQLPLEDIKKVIRQNSPTAGNANAPVTILAFIDFECPFSQEGYPIFKDVIDTYGSVATVVFKHFPIENIHPNAMPSAFASACAGEQGKFWEYYEEIFSTKQLDRISLESHAKQLDLNLPVFMECLDSEKYRSAVEQDLIDGVHLGVRGTPTYFVNGTKVEGVVSREVWDKVILENLKK